VKQKFLKTNQVDMEIYSVILYPAVEAEKKCFKSIRSKRKEFLLTVAIKPTSKTLLTLAETTSLSCIRKTPVAVNPMVPLNEPPIRLSILERAGVGKKPRVDEAVSDSIYKDTEWFPITSNICERLFSKAKLSVGHLRMAMTPMHLEMLMFLNCNRCMWNELTVTRVTKRVWKVVVPPAVAVVVPANADVQPAVLVATPTIGEVALL
jgi:hypothetical protein